jgi:hypothetical protein
VGFVFVPLPLIAISISRYESSKTFPFSIE